MTSFSANLSTKGKIMCAAIETRTTNARLMAMTLLLLVEFTANGLGQDSEPMGNTEPRFYNVASLCQGILELRRTRLCSSPNLKLNAQLEETVGVVPYSTTWSPIFGDDTSMEVGTPSEELIDLVRDNVFPLSWDLEGRQLELTNQRLVAVTTPIIHESIREFLSRLGKATIRETNWEVFALSDDSSASLPTIVGREVFENLNKDGQLVCLSKSESSMPFMIQEEASSLSISGDRGSQTPGLGIDAVADPLGDGRRRISFAFRRVDRRIKPEGLMHERFGLSSVLGAGIVRSGEAILVSSGNGTKVSRYLVRAGWSASPVVVHNDRQLRFIPISSLYLPALQPADDRIDAGISFSTWNLSTTHFGVRAMSDIDRLIEVVKGNVDPAWDEDEDNQISPFKGCIVLRHQTQSDAVQELLRGFEDELHTVAFEIEVEERKLSGRPQTLDRGLLLRACSTCVNGTTVRAISGTDINCDSPNLMSGGFVGTAVQFVVNFDDLRGQSITGEVIDVRPSTDDESARVVSRMSIDSKIVWGQWMVVRMQRDEERGVETTVRVRLNR